MLSWISANAGTIIISVILICAVVLITLKLINNRKKGRSSCGCNCSNCPMRGECHPAR